MEPKKRVKGKHQQTDWGHGVKEIRRLKEAPAPASAPPKLELELDEKTARGRYTNAAAVSHGECEFVLDFLFLQPGQAGAKVHTRVVTSPLHAKRFLAALKENLERRERNFGR